MEVEEARDVLGKVGERLLILLGTVLDDGLIEVAIGGDITMLQEVIPVGKSTLPRGVIGEKKVEVRDTIFVVL